MSPDAVVAVAAGKGGTGKTLLSTSLALALHERTPGVVSLLDCDVEEPNAHLLLRPTWQSEQAVCTQVPSVDAARCTHCGVCAEACHTNAIADMGETLLVFEDLCSGCGLCAHLCPTRAIEETGHAVGTVRIGRTQEGLRVVSGCLALGQHRATPVIRAVLAEAVAGQVTVIDCPPGTACPMQMSVERAELCWLVTEPTPFGRSDLSGARATCDSLGVPSVVVVNRDGIGASGSAQAPGGRVVLRIPHDRRIAEAYARGLTLAAAQPEWRTHLLAAWDQALQSRHMAALRAPGVAWRG